MLIFFFLLMLLGRQISKLFPYTTLFRSSQPVGRAILGTPESVKRFTAADLKGFRSEEHTSELQSLRQLVCRLLLEKKKSIRSKRRVNRNTHLRNFSELNSMKRHNQASRT